MLLWLLLMEAEIKMTTNLTTQKAFPMRFCKSLKWFEAAQPEEAEGYELH